MLCFSRHASLLHTMRSLLLDRWIHRIAVEYAPTRIQLPLQDVLRETIAAFGVAEGGEKVALRSP